MLAVHLPLQHVEATERHVIVVAAILIAAALYEVIFDFPEDRS